MAGQGFASLSKQRRKEVAHKGMAKLRARGDAHVYTREEAQAANRKAMASRKANTVKAAAIRLLRAGFTPEQLVGLTGDEMKYFGGKKAGMRQVQELRSRLGMN